jgi:DNA polymerase-3 subunit gamma/tau
VSYLVLARKYRPQSFEDLVGQSHVARTLANAIATGRVAHAFLFTGVRGVGKTTSARLLAKCLNCMGPDGKAAGPTATPCQVCAPCREIASGVDMDVQEIDGASYNGVDEVRRLQEGLAFRPARDRFKIYIVDEVHMLSNAAWNAFLKTLEEPPPHVKFIFATTEVHKVPVTILSRCQRYDFKLIATHTIAERLREVLAKESIVADDLSLATLAREAAGSMRDAMSLLDQVIAFSGEKLTGEDVARVLGVPSRSVLHDLAAALVGGDAPTCLQRVDDLAGQGFDLAHVARDFLRHLRNLVVAKVCGDGARALLDLADEEVRDVHELAGRTDADDLTRIYQGFSRGFDDVVRSGQPRMALEMTLVRLARRPPLLPLDELLARLGDLEKRLGGGPPPPPRTSGAGAAPRGGAGSKGSGAIASAPLNPARGNLTSGALALANPALEPVSDLHALSPEPVEITPTPPPTSAVALRVAPPTSPLGAMVPMSAEPDAHAQRLGEAVGDPLASWRAILRRVAEARPALGSVFEHASILELTPERATFGFEAQSFAGAQAREPEALEILTREVRAHFAKATHVSIDLVAPKAPASHPATIASIDAAKRREAADKARAVVKAHPLVVEAMRLFGAELREVRIREEEE